METNSIANDTGPELKSVVGALLYGAPEPLTVRALRKLLIDTAAAAAAPDAFETAFATVSEKDIGGVLAELRRELEERPLGFQLLEVAGGYRFFTDPACAPWVRRALGIAKPARLSRPALETLAIIAYRQPVTRSEIESVRGVSVDHVIRNLLELQLARINGRADLPGKPLLYGTTPKFLEHFGLKEIGELPGIAELARRDAAAAASRTGEPETAGAPSEPPPEDGNDPADDSPLAKEPS